jgi:[acyl-carrier-protein] S-malonyltransferase
MSLGFVFPGQGSQSVGMLALLAQVYPQVQATFAEASEVLGYDLWDLVRRGPEQQLNHTQYTQPAMLAAGIAVWRVWQHRQARMPSVMAGHSLGEYTALVCSGSLRFESAVALVAERGRLMAEAVPEGEGAMAAVLGLEPAKVVEICEAAAQGEVVEAANLNAPEQVVIAGHAPAVERALRLAREAGAKRSVRLAVSIPSHCRSMTAAAERLAQSLEKVEFGTPTIPILHNVDAQFHQDPVAIRQALARQLYSPVRWTDTLQRLSEGGIALLVECGPGKVLVGLAKRTIPAVKSYPVFDPQTLEQALNESLRTPC